MGSKMGRPTENPKNTQVKIRITQDDRAKIDYCCKELEYTQYMLLMEHVNEVYDRLTKK